MNFISGAECIAELVGEKGSRSKGPSSVTPGATEKAAAKTEAGREELSPG